MEGARCSDFLRRTLFLNFEIVGGRRCGRAAPAACFVHVTVFIEMLPFSFAKLHKKETENYETNNNKNCAEHSTFFNILRKLATFCF